MEWISVKDRLPEVHKSEDGDFCVSDFILVFSPDCLPNVFTANYENDGEFQAFNSYTENSCGTVDVTVTHWMPLPEPPK